MPLTETPGSIDPLVESERTAMADKLTAQEDSTPTIVSFADSELGQIQGILLGDHARRVDERIATLEDALLGALADLRTELRAALQSLDGKVKTEETNRMQVMKNLGLRIDTESDLRGETERQLTHKIDTAESALRTVIADERTAMTADTERELNALRHNSVHRKDLAEFFAQTAEKLRDDND